MSGFGPTSFILNRDGNGTGRDGFTKIRDHLEPIGTVRDVSRDQAVRDGTGLEMGRFGMGCVSRSVNL